MVHCSICDVTFRATPETFAGLDERFNKQAFVTRLMEFIQPHAHWLGGYDEAAAERYIQLAER